MIEKYLSVQDMLGVACIIGTLIKVFQFIKEGKFKK
jgi:hypothetical protein